MADPELDAIRAALDAAMDREMGSDARLSNWAARHGASLLSALDEVTAERDLAQRRNLLNPQATEVVAELRACLAREALAATPPPTPTPEDA